MPFLRFARDKRGYETTSLVHAFRGRQGRARQKVLYWFRTPPNVKVGRPALDEDAIRWIEENNPEIDFDWPKILEARPPAQLDESEGRRERRPRVERSPGSRGPRGQMPPQSPQETVAAAIPRVEIAPPDPVATIGPAETIVSEPGPSGPDAEPGAECLDASPTVQAAPAETVGYQQLTRLRARYAELQARILERGGEPARVNELTEQAASLDPDSWVTAEDVRRGIQEFEPRIRGLRAVLGLRPRRRSRRGRRGHREAAGPSDPDQAASVDPSSKSTSQGSEREQGPEPEDDGGGDFGEPEN